MSSLIVTDRDGHINEPMFKLHETDADAAQYGCEHYGRHKFIVESYAKWRKTPIGKFHQYRIATLQRIRKFKPPTK